MSETHCCTPRTATFNHIKDWQIHTLGCSAGMQGLPWHGPVVPVERVKRTREEQEHLATRRRHPAKGTRRPVRMCAGYTTTCPHRGCHLCLGLVASEVFG